MENHQLKNNEIPSVENEVESTSGLEESSERIDVEPIDEILNEVIKGQTPPFLVTEDYKIRREDDIPELDSEPECDIKERILSYNRKDKSLMELTRKFICKFEGAPIKILVLDQITVELKVERRRIYDIINIMESLNVVSKVKKNVYEWKGLKKAVETIEFYNNSCYVEFFKGKKEKSLESLAAEFLKLFSQRKAPLTLEEAAHIILSESNEQVKKTKIRRLYDIVNVFKCLGLVEKVKGSKFESGKPVYEWLGCHFLLEIIESKGYNIRTLEEHDDALNERSEINSMKDDTENMETNSRLFKPIHLDNIAPEENENSEKKISMKDLAMTDIENYENNMSIGNMIRKSSMNFNRFPKEDLNLKKQNSSPDYLERPKIIKYSNRKVKPNKFEKKNEEPSFFYGLFNHLNVTGNGSISDVYDRLTSIIWPN